MKRDGVPIALHDPDAYPINRWPVAVEDSEHEYMAVHDATQLPVLTSVSMGWQLAEIAYHDDVISVPEWVPHPQFGPTTVTRSLVVRRPVYILRLRRDAYVATLRTALQAAEQELRALRAVARAVAEDVASEVPEVRR